MVSRLTGRGPIVNGSAGFTLMELMIVVGMVGTLTAFVVPALADYIERARVVSAIRDIRAIQTDLASWETPPDDLSVIERDTMTDPWGNLYVYHKFVIPPGIAAQARKDRFLVPINSQYDLYSMGKDGDSRLPLSVPVSQDDIVAANDGGFVGLASRY